MQVQFSDNVSTLQPSAIREILKFTSIPGVISFAAGNPAPEAFPKETVAKLSEQLLREDPVLAMQYSLTEGYTPLRDALKQRMAAQHCFQPDVDDLIITSGAQQGNELTCKVLLNRGDTLICEAPSFIGSLNAFKSYGVNLVGIPMEADGMDLAALETALQTQPSCKLIYVIPNFQNPTGQTMSLEKRKGLYALACKYNVLILEDNPYGDLRYSGEFIPNIKSFDEDEIVIYCGSFSKVISPGMRVAYCIAPKQIFQKLVVCKQGSDVHTNIWSQYVCDEFITKYDFNAHLEKLRKLYTKKAQFCMDLLDKYASPAITYHKIDGGLFIWCDLPESIDMPSFCKEAVLKKVCVVPGNAFLTDENEKCNSFRINFSTPTDEQLEKGIKILGELANSKLK